MRVMYKKTVYFYFYKNTKFLQQVEDDVRGCSTTKYWIPSTSWRWCQRLFDYQILNSFNKLKMMSEVVWLPNTEFLQQVEDDVRGYSTTKYWPPSTSWRWCQRLFDYQILNSFNKLKMMSHKSLNNTQHLVKYGYYYNHKTIWLLFLHLNFIIYFS
jgi:hypothetical protein